MALSQEVTLVSFNLDRVFSMLQKKNHVSAALTRCSKISHRCSSGLRLLTVRNRTNDSHLFHPHQMILMYGSICTRVCFHLYRSYFEFVTHLCIIWKQSAVANGILCRHLAIKKPVSAHKSYISSIQRHQQQKLKRNLVVSINSEQRPFKKLKL